MAINSTSNNRSNEETTNVKVTAVKFD